MDRGVHLSLLIFCFLREPGGDAAVAAHQELHGPRRRAHLDLGLPARKGVFVCAADLSEAAPPGAPHLHNRQRDVSSGRGVGADVGCARCAKAYDTPRVQF